MDKSRPCHLDVGLQSFSSGFGTCNDLSSDTEKGTRETWSSGMKKSIYGRTVKKFQFPEKLQIIKPLEGMLLKKSNLSALCQRPVEICFE